MELLTEAAQWLVDVVGRWGYAGIFVLMLVESSFVPFPSEIVMPPAGYLASQGQMSFAGAVAAGIAGSIAGALLNYGLASWLGRPFFRRYGRFFLLPPARLERVERFFRVHGEISTFTGRLVAGVRQYISFPAGLAHMHLGRFVFFTAAGAGVWVLLLTWGGWLVGRNQALLGQYLHEVTLAALAACVVIVAGYVWWYRRRVRAGRRA
ncbi:MAG: DedA family protein [Gammaproteobacteria bacterium]|nr:DedA family protein [Gammaproteobacteria bacterium]